MKEFPLVLAISSAVLVGHFFYATRVPTITGQDEVWAEYALDRSHDPRLAIYRQSGEYWLGFSYALAAGFVAWCFLRILRMRREALTANAGGLTIGGVLWASVCFLTGCCGSPMLPVYLGLFGPNFIQSTKPLTFLITLVSLAAGYAWMVKRAPKAIRGQ